MSDESPWGRPQWQPRRRRLPLRPLAPPPLTAHRLRWLPLWCATFVFLIFCLIVGAL